MMMAMTRMMTTMMKMLHPQHFSKPRGPQSEPDPETTHSTPSSGRALGLTVDEGTALLAELEQVLATGARAADVDDYDDFWDEPAVREDFWPGLNGEWV